MYINVFVSAFLGRNANIEAKDEDSCTPLLKAASYGRKQTVAVLLDHDANVEQIDSKGRTALHWAVKGNHASTAKVYANVP